MATTQNEHNGNGTLRRFAFTFPYIKEDDVKVQVRTSTADVTDIASNTYTFPSATEIQFSAVTATTFQESTGAPKTGVTVRIFRDTDLDTERVTFFPGSSIRAQDLNDNTLQNLYASQERQNRAVDSTGGAMTGNLEMNNADIVFEGENTTDGITTTLTAANPATSSKTITLPNTTGTVVTTGDNGTVTSAMIANSTIVNADISGSAEIAVSKLADGNARQVLQTAADGTTVEFTDNVDLPGTLDVTGAATFDSTVTATTFTGNATSSSVLTPGRNIGGVAFDGSADINLPGVNAGGNQNTTGNAATATTLQNARNIAGQSFDGSANIDISPTNLVQTIGGNAVSVTADANEINQLDGVDLIPTSPTWTSTTQIPSTAQISDRIAELGGFEAIADEVSFPNTVPPAGVVISIGNANDLAVNGSGVGTGATVGGTSVTINGFPNTFNNTDLDDGIGLLVVKAGGNDAANQVYDFHRVVAKNEDVRQLSSDMDDFKARYRVGSSVPSDGLCGLDGTGTGNRPCDGDLFFNTGTGKMLVYDGDTGTADTDAAVEARWEEVQSIGNFKIIPASELNPFTGGGGTALASTTTITDAPTSAEQIILSINGVIQQPNAGSSAPTNGFALDGATIRLAATPAANSTAFGIIVGSSVNVGTPSNNTVDTAQLVDDGVTYAKMQDIATANRVLGRATAGEIQEVQVATAMIEDDAVTYAKMQHLANANRVLGATSAGAIGETQVVQAMLGDQAVNEAKLQVSNNPTDGQFLQCQSGNTGGLTWADAPTTNLDAAITINESGNDVDFRVESDDNENMLFVDGGENRVGINTGTPTFTLDVVGTDAVQLPAGTDGERPSGLNANDVGIMRFNTTSGQFEYWANTDDTPQFRLIGDAPQRTVAVQYLVIAGGGAGGAGMSGGCGGGGGAGGYRTNFGSGNISGRLSAVEAAMNVTTGSALSLSVGAGGTAMTGGTNSTDIPAGSDGSDSTFNTITSTGGGAGGRNDGGHGNDGGSGGGSAGRLGSANPGSGTAAQGFDGGDCTVDNDRAAGGGGGAGEAGDADQTTTGTSNRTASGGDGIASSITGSSVTRAGGGGAAGDSSSCTMTTMGGLGGSGGGGNGASTNSANGTAGTANTGGGGGGNLRNCSSSNSGAGGSGVIILRTATGVTARFSAGVVVNGTTVSANNTAVAGTVVGGGSTDLTWTVTAAASDTVTFS